MITAAVTPVGSVIGRPDGDLSRPGSCAAWRVPKGSSRPRRLRPLRLAPAIALLASLAAACGTGSSGTTTAGADAKASPGVVLRVADQSGSVEQPLRVSGELDGAPFEPRFASFANGPAVNEALRAGDVDVGTMGDVPAIGAVAGGLEVKVIGVTSSTGPGSILLARAGSGVRTLADLEGRKVAFTTGTAQQGFALRALETVGLTQGDVDQVDVPLQDLPSVLESGDADASVVTVEAQLKYVAAHPGAVSLVTARDLKPYVGGFFLASSKALADPAKRAAIEDLLARRVRAYAWVRAHPAEWAQAFYVGFRKQDPKDAPDVARATGTTQFVSITGAVQKGHQALADLLLAAGALPEEVDVSPLYDPSTIARTNAIVNKELTP